MAAAPMCSELSRFQRLLAALAQGPESQRRAFAEEALTSLAEIHIAEADLARNQAAHEAGGTTTLQWARAVYGYAGTLIDLLDEVSAGAPVGVSGGGPSPAVLTIDDTRIILTHPRIERQPAFEQAVLQAFCAARVCGHLLPLTESRDATRLGSGSVSLAWVFNNDGVLCAYDGVSVQFPRGVSVATVREVCEEFHREVTTLLVDLRRQVSQRVAIDWSGLSIAGDSDAPRHLVRLNTHGDAVLQPLPLLASRPHLLALLRPWLQQRIAGESSAELSIDAREVGWTGTS